MKSQLIASILLLQFISGCTPNGVQTVDTPVPKTSYENVDQFYQEIANRVRSKTGADKVPDIIVIPSEAVWPIGTVLRPGTTFPADATACVVPSDKVLSAPTPNIFPDYSSTYKKSADLGIDNELIKKLIDAGVKFSDKDEVSLKVSNSALELIDDTTYSALTNTSACRTVLSGRELWIVRGYAIGKRTFVFSSDVEKTAEGKIEKIGSFNIDFGSGNRALKVTDDQPEKFVQIISAVKIEQGIAMTSLPSTPLGTGRIYIQKDRQDTSSASQNVLNNLRAASFKVQSNIESIDSSKMPRIAQVRFFNESDREQAQEAASALKSQFPDISVIRLNIPSPMGQLEVWLPRVAKASS
ncbi:hypothetical protein [Aeromonas aquatica]|uniref:hypothetical protein n=1 Tax=Aeromonas aquatica TaxID=558964 RepID=UPI00286F574F|nr:hypothetical protein [Aeromonas aquatica]